MKDFVKMTLAVVAGLLVFAIVGFFLMFGTIGAIAAAGDAKPVMPSEAVLKIDLSAIALAEQTAEADPIAMLQGKGSVAPVGIYSAITAVNRAAQDPAIKYIYMRPDGVTGGFAQVEEFRKALVRFRESGKAIVSYIESPSNASYYLASASDKIYMTVHEGGMNMFTGISTQLIFLKDALDRLGINVQLIRHGKYKSAGEMYIRNSSSKENMEQNVSMITSMWDSWATDIAESRGISKEELNHMLNNLELNFPSDFLEKGMVDGLLTREELQQKLADLYVTDSYKNVKGISLTDYAKLNPVNLKPTNKVAVIYAEGNIVDGSDKEQVMKAARGYKDINLLAMKLLRPNGILATFSCSGAMTSDLFDTVVAEAAADAGRDFQVIVRTRQGADHPVAISFPEGWYLKGLVLRSIG